MHDTDQTTARTAPDAAAPSRSRILMSAGGPVPLPGAASLRRLRVRALEQAQKSTEAGDETIAREALDRARDLGERIDRAEAVSRSWVRFEIEDDRPEVHEAFREYAQAMAAYLRKVRTLEELQADGVTR